MASRRRNALNNPAFYSGPDSHLRKRSLESATWNRRARSVCITWLIFESTVYKNDMLVFQLFGGHGEKENSDVSQYYITSLSDLESS